MLEEDGYRMKFACYYPRVEYGQSSRLALFLTRPQGLFGRSCSSHRPTGSLFALIPTRSPQLQGNSPSLLSPKLPCRLPG